MDTARYSDVSWFVHELLWTGAWFDEVVTALSRELPADAYPGELPMHVIFERLWRTIEPAMESVAPSDLKRATEIIDLAADRVAEQLRLTDGLPECRHDGAAGDREGYG